MSAPPAHSHDSHGPGHAHGCAHAPGSSFAHGHPERIVPGDGLWEAHLEEHAQRYDFAAARMRRGGRVLDAGCGVGYGTAMLADAGASLAVGVDIAAEAITVARQQFSRPNAIFVQEDCMELAESARHAPFDCIVNLENLEHVGDAGRFLDRVVSLLAPDGVFVVSTPNRTAMNRMRGAVPDAPTTNPFHVVEWSSPELRELLRGRFDTVTLHYQAYDPPERLLYEPLLSLLWTNPFARLGRRLQRVLRGRHIAERVENLLPPLRHRILADDPGAHLAVTTIAECRHPRTAGS